MPRTEIADRIAEAARMLQLEPYLERRPRQLSGGQRQRVAIGRAVVREPRVFLFDEPLSNLDAELRVTMRGEIAELHRRLGNTMIYVTHDQVEAMTLVDRIVVLRDGRIEQAGTPLDLYNRPASRFVAGFIGSPRMNFVDGTVAATDPQGVDVADAAGRRYRAGVDANGLLPGEPVVLGIRPEHVALGGDGHTFEVRGVEQLGGASFLYCKTQDGLALTAHLPGQTAFTRGSMARASFDPAFAHLFRVADGRALRRLASGEAVGGCAVKIAERAAQAALFTGF
jgi:multiple sugar transport system ATP-binding protein